MSSTFIVGKTYTTGSACDRNCVFSYQIISRSASGKTMMVKRWDDKTVRVKIRKNADGSEWALPDGTFSMAPAIYG